MNTIHIAPALTFNGERFNAALAGLFPASVARTQFAAAFGANLQHFSLWDLEDETRPAHIRERLLDAVLLANGIRLQVLSFRLASVMVPAISAARTPEVDITLDSLQTLAERLSGVARELIAGNDLSPETLLARCNSLDGTLENLKIEAQYLCIQIQENGQPN
jgi:hypothetical protein